MNFQYQKNPIVVEAFQFNKSEHDRVVPQWFLEAFFEGTIFPLTNKDLAIRTLEGDLTISDGDWIIRGVQGELYPCKEDIFKVTYTKLDEAKPQ